MQELTTDKVNRWLFWIIIAFFILVTYLNFQMLFGQMAQILLSLPSWFLLMTGVVVIVLMIHFINQVEREITHLERELFEQQGMLMEMERLFRLVKQDLTQISPREFKYYCVNILKAQGYEEVKVVTDQVPVDITALDFEGKKTYIKCVSTSLEILREEIHKLHYKMLQDGVEQGIVLTNGPVNEEEESWASTFKIKCLNGKNLNQIAHNLLDLSKIILS